MSDYTKTCKVCGNTRFVGNRCTECSSIYGQQYIHYERKFIIRIVTAIIILIVGCSFVFISSIYPPMQGYITILLATDTATLTFTPSLTFTASPSSTVDVYASQIALIHTADAQSQAISTEAPSSTPYPSATPTRTSSPSVTPFPSPPVLPSLTNTPIFVHNQAILYATYNSDTNRDGEVSNTDNSLIYLWDLNSRQIMAITSISNNNYDPRLSADGQTLAYTRLINDVSYIYLQNRITGNEQRLVEGLEPAWSPDGQWIVYRALGGNSDIRVISRDGGSYANLTNADINETNWAARWSPDGQFIYFLSRRQDTTGDGVVVGCDSAQIYRINVNTYRQTAITDTSRNFSSFDISPDGQTIVAMQSWEDTPSVDNRRCGWNDSSAILLINIANSHVETLVPRHAYSRQPVFSPTGNEIIYLTANRDYNGDGVRTIADARTLIMLNLVTHEETSIMDSEFQIFDISWVNIP